jgi:DNA-binding PadR family transcriptional regulator
MIQQALWSNAVNAVGAVLIMLGKAVTMPITSNTTVALAPRKFQNQSGNSARQAAAADARLLDETLKLSRSERKILTYILLVGRPVYGRELIQETGLSNPTVYASLIALADRGILDAEEVKNLNGPPRNDYFISGDAEPHVRDALKRDLFAVQKKRQKPRKLEPTPKHPQPA